MRKVIAFGKAYGGIGLLVAAILCMIPLGNRLVNAAARTGGNPPTPIEVSSFAIPDSIKSSELLLYSETQPEDRTSFWLTSPGDLNHPQQLATTAHKPGYPPQAFISSSTRQVALSILPPGAPESLARTSGSQVWLLGLKGDNPQLVFSGAAALAGWSPDGRSLLLYRLVPRDTSSPDLRSPAGQIPFRTEYFQVSLPDATSQLIFSDEGAYGLQPLGWSPDSSRFFFARLLLSGQWEVAAWDRATGQVNQVQALPDNLPVTGLSISPDSLSLLIETKEEGAAGLEIMDLPTGSVHAIATQPQDGSSIAPLSALFSPSGDQILVNLPDQAAKPSTLERIALHGSLQSQDEAALLAPSQGGSWLPVRWSPSGNWLVWLDSQSRTQDAYLQPAGSSQAIPLPHQQPGSSIHVSGFLGAP